MRPLSTLLPLLALAGCISIGGPVIKTTPVQLSKDEAAVIQSSVRPQLKDPESARFGRMVAGVDDNGVLHACLLVNAKNSYGGYTGEQPFGGVMNAGSFVITEPAILLTGQTPSPDVRDFAWREQCRKRGLTL